MGPSHGLDKKLSWVSMPKRARLLSMMRFASKLEKLSLPAPHVLGEINWQAPSYSPRNNPMFAAVNNICMDFTLKEVQDQYRRRPLFWVHQACDRAQCKQHSGQSDRSGCHHGRDQVDLRSALWFPQLGSSHWRRSSSHRQMTTASCVPMRLAPAKCFWNKNNTRVGGIPSLL